MEAQYNARNPAVKRLFREAQELAENPDEDFHAAPLEDNLFEWHFTIRGPADTPFENGLYHGRIILPTEYPMKPPNIIILTPNGRFETNTKICLSISGYHPETWQPSWSIRTALKALIGFMPTPASGAIGSLELPEARRRELAQISHNWSCPECSKTNKVIFTTNATAGAGIAAVAASPTAAAGDRRDVSPASPTSVSGSDVESRRSPESASGGGDSDDSFSTSQPIRPRSSSLQSKPGRGVGKHAHFEDEAPSSPLVTTTAAAATVTPAPRPESSYSFPPVKPPTDNAPQSETPPPVTTPSPTPTVVTPQSADSMRTRQAAILVERRRLLQERLAATVPPSAATAPPVAPAVAAMGSADLARLERAILMIRQIVVLILFCLTFLILRRFIMEFDEEDLEDL